MITTKQKPIKNIQNIERKKFKHTTTENHQMTKEESKKIRKEQRNYKQPENKMAKVSPGLSIIKCKRIKFSS